MAMSDVDVDKSVFVTVGSTSFDELIKASCAPPFCQLLVKLGYSRLTLQIGRGSHTPNTLSPVTGLSLSWYRYKETLADDMQEASLIISHGGAASIMESLSLGKPLVVVVNEELMGNHQAELAEEMSALGVLLYTTHQKLYNTIEKLPRVAFAKYEPGHPEKLGEEIDRIMGFIS